MPEEHRFAPGDPVTGDSCTDIAGTCTGTYVGPHHSTPEYTEIADDRWRADDPSGGNTAFVYTNSLRPAGPRVSSAAASSAAAASHRHPIAQLRSELAQARIELGQAYRAFQENDEANLADAQALAERNEQLRSELDDMRRRATILPEFAAYTLYDTVAASATSSDAVTEIRALLRQWSATPDHQHGCSE